VGRSGSGVTVVEVRQRREFRHAVSASEMWEEDFMVSHGLRGFVATHLSARHLTEMVKESNDRPRNCLRLSHAASSFTNLIQVLCE
jgi:hypothetical protein